MKRFNFVFIALFFVISVSNIFSQEKELVTKDICRERANEMVKNFEKSNSLYLSVMNGNTGDCIRQPWMDLMEEHGIKRVMILMKYSWKGKDVKFKVKRITYQSDYYRGEIVDGKVLKDISTSGLEESLKIAALGLSKKSVFSKREENTVKSDVFQIDFLDDESLPQLFWIF